MAAACTFTIAISGPFADLLVVALFGLGLLSWWAVFDIVKRTPSEWPTTGISRQGWVLIVFLLSVAGVLGYLGYGPPRSLGPRKR